jgi:hypothetical protein
MMLTPMRELWDQWVRRGVAGCRTMTAHRPATYLHGTNQRTPCLSRGAPSLKRGHAVVADSGNRAHERLAAGVVFRGAQQPQATAPGGKGGSGLRSEQTCQCATADPDGVCPSIGVEA